MSETAFDPKLYWLCCKSPPNAVCESPVGSPLESSTLFPSPLLKRWFHGHSALRRTGSLQQLALGANTKSARYVQLDTSPRRSAQLDISPRRSMTLNLRRYVRILAAGILPMKEKHGSRLLVNLVQGVLYSMIGLQHSLGRYAAGSNNARSFEWEIPYCESSAPKLCL